MSTPRYASVGDYLASLDPVKAATVRGIIDLILTEFPALDVKLAWNTPQIVRKSKYVAGISSLKHHLAFAPWSQTVLDAFRPRLEGYVVRKNLFQIPDDWEIDRALILDLVRARLAELDAA